MTKKVNILLIVVIATMSGCCQTINPSRVVSNPIDIKYAFHRQEQVSEIPPEDLAKMTVEQREKAEKKLRRQIEAVKRSNGAREAADPIVIVYRDKYYLFPSKSEGYFCSDDMQHWSHITTDILPITLYAPTGMVYNGELYWAVSDINKLYKTTSPEDGNSWKLVTDQLTPYPDKPGATAHDPDLFADEDGRVYFYYGCSDFADIMGIELDPKNNFSSIGQSVTLITHKQDIYGWERPGNRNEHERSGWNEGPTMFKYNGKYYLQYASPGTKFDPYGDGIYVSDKPLGPFTHLDASPMSIKPGGWMTGAGHGHTFQDLHGNYWHTASCVISQRMNFERRIGFFPVFFTKKGNMYALTDLSDSPYVLPDKKVDFEKKAPWTGWRVLSDGKKAAASSSLEGCPAEFGTDNTIKTMWSAATGEAGEWFQIDLGNKDKVCAVQTNFADKDFGFFEKGVSKSPYAYIVEYSIDGKNWETLFDKSENNTDNPHELLVCGKPVKARFIRITNFTKLTGKFSIFDLRIFGFAPGRAPEKVNGLDVTRAVDRRSISFKWDHVPNATGYILRWGTEPDELYSACESKDADLELNLFSSDTDYYFTVDSFNETGVTRGTDAVHVE